MAPADLSQDPLLAQAPLHEGYKVLGGVVLYEKLGQGGMGAVYRGRNLRLNVDVAVKVMATPTGLPPDQADNYVKRFIREAQVAASINHPSLVRVTDLGLAKAYESDDDDQQSMLTQTQTGIGTPYYMPPEQFVAARDVGPTADVWALGVTLYHLIAGKLPWSDSSVFVVANMVQHQPLPDLKKKCPTVSDDVVALIEKAVQKDAKERFPDCGEMARALRKLKNMLTSDDTGDRMHADEHDAAVDPAAQRTAGVGHRRRRGGAGGRLSRGRARPRGQRR